MRKQFIGALITLQLIVPGLITAQHLQETASARSPQENVQAVAGASDARSNELQDQALKTLITRAEQHFQRGETEYRQGNLTRAREEFDRAVDVILEAKIDVRSIPQLLTYYRGLIERINAYQADSIARGQGFSEQKYEVSLLEELANVKLEEADVTASQDENIRAELDFPFEMTPEVRQFIHYFTNNRRGRATMETGLRRSGRYLEMARQTFREEGVPLDLVWLAQAESNWRAEARSRKAAQGIWQFVSFTGAKYGLRQNAWLDERSGIEQPTRAAARYLRFLHDRYLDWQLALAGYNCGEGAVDRAIAASGYADFWYLHRNRLLPAETRNYVPIIIAIIIVAKNPEKYGFTVEPEPVLTYDKVTVEGPLDLRLIAEAVGAPLGVVEDLNPELRRGLIPAGEEYAVRVPVGAGEQFQELIARIPSDRRSYWRVYEVAQGETIAEIAQKHRLTPLEIARANELDAEVNLTVGDRLVIPSETPRVSVNTYTGVELARRTYTRTTIKARPGDTISKIAARYGISANDLARMNRLRVNSKLRAGQQIVLNLPASKSTNQKSTRRRVTTPQPSKSKGKTSANKAQSSRRVTHQVRSGDTLTHIANRYGVSVTELRRWNQLPSNRLKAGQSLVIYR